MLIPIPRAIRMSALYGAVALAVGIAPAYASELSSADAEHARNAFYFAERDNWPEALLHARRSRNEALRTYFDWRSLKASGIDRTFSDYANFIVQHEDWPDITKLRQLAEASLDGTDFPQVQYDYAIQWFTRFPPLTGKGKLALAQALARKHGLSNTRQKYQELVRDAWIQGDFDPDREKEIMRAYGDTLRQEDHIARIDRLIWEGKTTAASRLFFAVPKGHQTLFEARIRLSLNKPGSNQAVAKVPSSLMQNPGLIYERMKWRERKGMDSGVRELLLAAPSTVPYPEKWWKTRHIQIRDALDEGNAQLALKLLANHGQTEGIGLADALWLKGWVELTYRKSPAQAATSFQKMFESVNYPVSLSRAAYWAAKALQEAGQREEANRWYSKAAQHSTTFYGQLSLAQLGPNRALPLPGTPMIPNQQRSAFQGDLRTHAAKMLGEIGREDLAYPFLTQMLETAPDLATGALITELATQIGNLPLGVKTAKEALKRQMVLTSASYPTYRTRIAPAIEPALMWAITRQESMFDPHARSSAGATGLMQLLPSTAKEVARKNDIAFAPYHLQEVDSNLRLGTIYLGSVIEGFDGSYILGIAAYNAGPGNVRKWIAKYGRPGKRWEDAVQWIEKIPFSETRNYVQRVLENLQVYRQLTASNQTQAAMILNDLSR